MSAPLTRRHFVRAGTTALAAPFVLNRALQAGPPGCGARPPNIVFIMADDLGFADLGCYGQRHIRTPNIDRLAAEGMRFTQCYAGSSVCAPSRSVLMTGQHTGHTTVRGNFGADGGRVPLNAGDVTVAEVLKQAGYTTAMTGKWGLGEPGTTGEPNLQGFDEWFGYLNQRNAHSYYPDYLWRNQEQVFFPNNNDTTGDSYSHDLFAQFMLDFVRKHADEPFFLYLPFTIPHDDYVVPQEDFYANEPWGQTERIYASMVTRMDLDIGRLMHLLRQSGIDQDTLVFFCSDNGAAKAFEGTFDSSGPLRGIKRDLTEGGIRTPMIARWPGNIPAGSVSDTPWYFPDVLPTLAAVAGASSPGGIDGLDVLPTLLGQPQALPDRYLYWEFHENPAIEQAIRWRDWKGIRTGLDGTLRLYDLALDPGETTDVAGANPDVVGTLEDFLENARTPSQEWPV